MATPITANGSLYLDGQLLVDGVEVTLNQTYENLTAEMAFGETTAPQDLGPEKVDGSIRWRYTQAEFDRIWTIYKAKSAVTLVATPVSGAGERAFTVSVKLASMPLQFKAGQVIYCTANIVGASGAGVTKAPALTMTPAAGALTAGQQGVAHAGVTFVAAGGNDPYVYTMTGFIPGMTLTGDTYDGTPTAQGTYLIEVTATDDDDVAITKRYTMVIAAP